MAEDCRFLAPIREDTARTRRFAVAILSEPLFSMEDLLPLISRHGYSLLAAVCFAEAIGFPLPAALAILTAGAVAD